MSDLILVVPFLGVEDEEVEELALAGDDCALNCATSSLYGSGRPWRCAEERSQRIPLKPSEEKEKSHSVLFLQSIVDKCKVYTTLEAIRAARLSRRVWKHHGRRRSGEPTHRGGGLGQLALLHADDRSVALMPGCLLVVHAFLSSSGGKVLVVAGRGEAAARGAAVPAGRSGRAHHDIPGEWQLQGVSTAAMPGQRAKE